MQPEISLTEVERLAVTIPLSPASDKLHTAERGQA